MQATSGRPKTVITIFSMLILLAIVSAVSVGTSLIPGAFGGRQFNGTPQARVTVGPVMAAGEALTSLALGLAVVMRVAAVTLLALVEQAQQAVAVVSACSPSFGRLGCPSR